MSDLVQAESIESDEIRLTTVTHPAVNLALTHNRVPMIHVVEVANLGPADLTDVTVVARMTGLKVYDEPEWSRTINVLPSGTAARFEAIHDVVPPESHLSSLTEGYPATIEVTVAAAETRTALTSTRHVHVLAHNEWLNAPFCYESLAAFVQPNSRAVMEVLNRAASILESDTGDPSLQGYQAGARRAGEIAAAVYAALSSHGIRYINPPASFERSGQKIRTPRQVLEDRFGTCIDLAVTYASCLEQAGLHPHLWIVQGHAFTGFMRDESTLPTPVLLEPNKMLNLAESGRAIVVEAAFYSGGAPTLSTAVATAKKHLASPRSLFGLVDVRAARQAGVRPLPLFEAGEARDTPTQPEPATPERARLDLPEELTTEREYDQVIDITDTSPARVKRWKRSLLDLSTRNRLLNLRPSAEVLYLPVPPVVLPVLDDLIHAGKLITLRPSDDLSGLQFLQGIRSAGDVAAEARLELLTSRRELFAAVTEERYPRLLKNLQRTARTLLEETGSTNLYLTLGSLVHSTASGAEARAPLFLLPIRITGGKGNSRFEIQVDSTGVASPNHCLTEWLRVNHSVVIDDLSTPPVDESGIDLAAALAGIRRALITNNLDFRIDDDAAVAICKFGTFGMWRDLQECWEILEQSPLVDHLIHRPGDSFIPPAGHAIGTIDDVPVDETAHPLPVPYDGSQFKAVEASAAGHTFVLQGPPGTGKSQTITNMIARNLAAGRTVLFVAEKQAALDVVRRRLASAGLTPFTLDLHGVNQTGTRAREQLKVSLDLRLSHNAHAWDAELSRWRTRYTPVAEYPAKIHSSNRIGQSLWAAADTVATQPDEAYIDIPHRFVSTASPEQSTTVRTALTEFSRIARRVAVEPSSPWLLAASPASDAEVHDAWTRLHQAAEALSDRAVAGLIEAVGTPQALATLLDRHRHETATFVVPDQEVTRTSTDTWRVFASTAAEEFRRLHESTRVLSTHFNPAFLANGDGESIAQMILDSRRGFGRKKKEQRAEAALRGVAIAGTDLSLDQAVPLLQSLPSVRAHRDHVRTQLSQVYGPLLQSSWDPLQPGADAHLSRVHAELLNAQRFAAENPTLWRVLRGSGVSVELARRLSAVSSAWLGWCRALGATPQSTGRWLGERTWLTAWRDSQPQWASDMAVRGSDSMRQWAAMSAALEPVRAHGLDSVADDLLAGRIPAELADAGYLSGVARASIAERTAYHGLAGFTAAVRDGQTADFTESTASIRRQLSSTLPAQIAARRPFAPGGLSGAHGRLRRSLDQKRRAPSIRSLFADYGEEILSATPCLLVSPASLAQFVPPGAVTFDLVIFDEASQVTVAQSIGALGRARAAVVVGDSKQMPPTLIGVATGGDEDDDGEAETAVPEDLESILTECVESGVPALSLTWHYRSQDEALIAFSNEKYYDGRLASLPTPGGDPETGVELRRVEGHFNREDKKNEFRTNRVEAEAIVAEVERLVGQDPTASIGIVTFNRQQQDLILNLLEASKLPAVQASLSPERNDGLFVKNLENVQGDERDIILFSTAFSKPSPGAPLPLNFGPLTRSGGEKRLNVAVTRARRRVVMFTSFDPSDIDLNRTRSVGMAHLRAYLEAASNSSTRYQPHNRVPAGAIESEIATSLRAAGLEVTQNYGLSEFVVDIAVRAPGADRWQVAVMLDGARWESRPTVADRELTPGLLASMMGWSSVIRVWLADWLQNRDDVIARVQEAVASADDGQQDSAADTGNGARAAIPSAYEPDNRATDTVATQDDSSVTFDLTVDIPADATPVLAGVTAIASNSTSVPDNSIGAVDRTATPRPYVSAPTSPLGSRDDLATFGSGAVRDRIQAALLQTIAIEGPIELERLATGIGRRFGLDRVRASRREEIESLVPAQLIRRDGLGDFVWPTDLDPVTWRGFRRPTDDQKRSLEQIAPEEIANAMAYTLREGPLAREQLLRESMHLLGHRKLTAKAEERLSACLARAHASGLVVRCADGESFALAL